jgi:hypothetical protein
MKSTLSRHFVATLKYVLGTLMLLAAPAHAQCLDEWLPGQGVPGANATVVASVQYAPPGGTLATYVAGSFSYLGSERITSVARWTGSTFEPVAEFNGPVSALCVFDNKLIVGGAFTTIDGVSIARIAAWNGTTWQSLGSGIPSGGVLALTTSGSRLFAGGVFTNAGGVTVSNVAQWTGSVWQAVGTGLNAQCRALQWFGGFLYAGGDFSTAGGVTTNRLARWNSSSGWNTAGTFFLNSQLSSQTYVVAFAVVGADLYAAGQYLQSGSSVISRVSRFLPTTVSWGEVGTTAPDTFSEAGTLAAHDGKLIFGGYFRRIGTGGALGQPDSNGIASYNGTSWSPLGTGLSPSRGTVSGLVSLPEGLLASGLFDMAGTTRGVANLLRWDGTTWLPVFTDGTNGRVLAMLRHNDQLYIAGSFSRIEGVQANGIARWNGTSWEAFGQPLADASSLRTVKTLASYNGELIAGGQFSIPTVAGTSNIARWDGSSWAPLGSGCSSIVEAFEIFNGELIVGGSFTSAGGVAGTSKLARWNGSSWSAFVPGVASETVGGVLALKVHGNDLMVAGGSRFRISGIAGTTGIAAWNGSTWSPLASGVPEGDTRSVQRIASDGTSLYIAGDFPSVTGISGTSGLARWDGSAWSSVGGGLKTLASGAVSFGGLWVNDGTLYASGQFDAVATTSQPVGPFLAKFSSTWESVATTAPTSGGMLFEDTGTLYVGATVPNTSNAKPSVNLSRLACQSPPVCPGDLNGDTIVDDADFVLFADAYNLLDCLDPLMPVGCPSDLNSDQFVDDADFVLFADAYNALLCP